MLKSGTSAYPEAQPAKLRGPPANRNPILHPSHLTPSPPSTLHPFPPAILPIFQSSTLPLSSPQLRRIFELLNRFIVTSWFENWQQWSKTRIQQRMGRLDVEI